MMINRRLTIPALVSALCLSVAANAGQDDQSSSSANASSQSSQKEQSDQQQQQAQPRSEQSADQLKVSNEEMNQQVTDVNKASKLIGMTVKNKKDESLGSIKDIVLDMKSGKVAYAVLSNGAILGFGGKNVAVPFQALTVKPAEKALLLDMDKQELAQAPGFNDKQWPDLNAAATGKTIGLASSGSNTNANATAVGGSESAGEEQGQSGSGGSSKSQTGHSHNNSQSSSQTEPGSSAPADTNNASSQK